MDNICLYLNYLPELPTEFPKNFVNHFDFVSGIKAHFLDPPLGPIFLMRYIK